MWPRGHTRNSHCLGLTVAQAQRSAHGDALPACRIRPQKEGRDPYVSAETSCTAMRISSGRFLALSFCLSCEQALTTVL